MRMPLLKGFEEMNEERLIAIEIKLSHQELLIDELNEVIRKQQESIDRIESSMKAIIARTQEAKKKETGPANEKPPHY